MASYTTIDYLPDLSADRIGSARILAFEPYTPTITGVAVSWDHEAWFDTNEKYALLKDTFVFEGKAGATYDIYSSSFFDPFILELYDNFGNVMAFDDNTGSYGMDHLEYVAPYDGKYYVSASWDQGDADSHRFVSLAVYEDVDTISVKNDIERIFNWGESAYPHLFPDHQNSMDMSGFHLRMYSNGDALGEKNGDIYYYDGGAGGTQEASLVGSISDFLPLAAAAGF